jgi:hypothetical protein
MVYDKFDECWHHRPWEKVRSPKNKDRWLVVPYVVYMLRRLDATTLQKFPLQWVVSSELGGNGFFLKEMDPTIVRRDSARHTPNLTGWGDFVISWLPYANMLITVVVHSEAITVMDRSNTCGRGFESYSRHGWLCGIILFVSFCM